MATVDEGSKEGRDTQVDLNIVPFIDLLSVCIIFLLVTAVWTQVSMIQIGSSIYAKRTETGDVETPPRSEIAFRLDVKDTGYVVRVGKQVMSIPKVNGAYDEESLYKQLKAVKTQYPDKNDAIISVMESLTYEELIRGMDLLLNSGFGEISVATGGAS